MCMYAFGRVIKRLLPGFSPNPVHCYQPRQADFFPPFTEIVELAEEKCHDNTMLSDIDEISYRRHDKKKVLPLLEIE